MNASDAPCCTATQRAELGWPPPDPRKAPFYRFQDNVFMDKEGEAHARIRSLVSKVFTPKRVESLRGVLEQTTHRLIDAVEAKGECDFVRDIAEPLPVIMIADLLGIPQEPARQPAPVVECHRQNV